MKMNSTKMIIDQVAKYCEKNEIDCSVQLDNVYGSIESLMQQMVRFMYMMSDTSVFTPEDIAYISDANEF